MPEISKHIIDISDTKKLNILCVTRFTIPFDLKRNLHNKSNFLMKSYGYSVSTTDSHNLLYYPSYYNFFNHYSLKNPFYRQITLIDTEISLLLNVSTTCPYSGF